jgi:outer membrane protein TolC
MMTLGRVFPVATSLVLAGVASVAAAQTPLTLNEAIRLATTHSESLTVAHAAESRADADIARVRSQKLPQINTTASYSRTLASEFSAAVDNTGPVCAPFAPDPSKSLIDRVAEIERAGSCGSIGPSFNFSNLPFGRKNIYQLGFSFAQAIYAGGRITAQQRQAETARKAAALATSTTEAQVTLDVTRAFYDAALAVRLVTFAESTYNQADAALEQARLSFNAGRQPEFELLRAQVARDNQRPTVIRRRADRDVAYLRLRQLLELPADAPLVIEADLETPALAPPAPFAVALAEAKPTTADDHLTVQQSAAAVSTRESAIRIAHADRLPSVSLSSSLAKVGYPSSGAFPGPDDFRTNWSLAATLQMPLFTGGRLQAGEASARADLTAAQAQLKQSRELAELDDATAKQDLLAAQAVWEASASTVEQAERAYQIADLRNREGLSTQLELSDSRLSLQVAQATRAQAARDVQVARARVALGPSLPAGAR